MEIIVLRPLHTLKKLAQKLTFLPPANEVWGKVIFLHLSVILFTGWVPGPGGCLVPGGTWSWRVCSGGGGAWSWGVCSEECLVPEGVCSQGGAWWRTPQDGYFCGRYASYWNAFLFFIIAVTLYECDIQKGRNFRIRTFKAGSH